MTSVRCSIKLAAKKSGVSTHLIRMWEKRYGAIAPSRTDTNRRLYSEDEIERLRLLRVATDAGHRIGNIAGLPDESLRELAAESALETTRNDAGNNGTGKREDLFARALQAVTEMNAQALQQVLDAAAVAHGHQGLLTLIVAPLAQRIGELWRDGTLTAAHEHFATSAIRTILLGPSRAFASGASAPTLIAVTPTGQLHELGAVIVAAAARASGWHVVYLGASLPAAEIAGAAIHHRARAVALSIVYPIDDANLPGELHELRRLLPVGIDIVAGGRSASGYADPLAAIGATRVHDLSGFYDFLDACRKTPAGA